jgi:hypothetical protein
MKSISRIIFVLIVSLTLSGCFWNTKETIKATVVVQKKTICIDPPQSSKVLLKEVEPIAVKDELGIYWVGITPKHYENLSQNISDMFVGLKQKNAIIEYYKKCLEDKPDAPKEKSK